MIGTRKPRKPDTTLETPALAGAKQDGRSNHETLYGNKVREKFKFQVFAYVCLAMVIWDRVEISRYTHEKLYAAAVIKETKDGGIEWYGTPDPAWKPDDRTIVDELIKLIDTTHGRTTDAKFDKKRWEAVFKRCTERGCNSAIQQYTKLQAVEDKGRIVVTITSINKGTDNTFYFGWREEREDEQGQLAHTYHFRGIFNVMIDVPTTLDVWTANPSGVWNDGFSVSEEKRS